MPTWVFPFSPRPHATTICSRIGGFLPHIPRQSGRCGTNGDQVGNDKRGRIKKDNSPSILLFKDEPSLQKREIITGRDVCPTRNDKRREYSGDGNSSSFGGRTKNDNRTLSLIYGKRYYLID
jgi:hypothetical protein